MNLTHYLTRAACTAAMLLVLSINPSAPLAQESEPEDPPTLFLALVIGNPEARETAVRQITATWRDEYIPMTLESVTLMRDSATAAKMMHLLEEKPLKTLVLISIDGSSGYGAGSPGWILNIPNTNLYSTDSSTPVFPATSKTMAGA